MALWDRLAAYGSFQELVAAWSQFLNVTFTESPQIVEIIDIRTLAGIPRGEGIGMRFLLQALAYCNEHRKRLIGSNVTNVGLAGRLLQQAKSLEGNAQLVTAPDGSRQLVYDPPGYEGDDTSVLSKRAMKSGICPTCGDPLKGEHGTFCPRCKWTEDDANIDSDPLSNPPDPTVDLHKGIQASTDRQAGMTRNQYFKQIADLEAKMGPDRSKLRHQFDNGWAIYSPQTRRDVRRTGLLMGHCWKGGWNGTGEPHVLRDPDGIPRMAFNVGEPHMGGVSGPIDPSQMLPGHKVVVNNGTHAPSGHDSSRPKPDHWAMLREWAAAQQPPVRMWHTTGDRDIYGNRAVLGEPGPNPYWDAEKKEFKPTGLDPATTYAGWYLPETRSIRMAAAAPKVMYHVSPAHNRDSIMSNGLRQSDVDGIHVWLFPDVSSAQAMQTKLWSGSRQNDIWAVDTSGMNIVPDPHGWPHGRAVRQAIPPERLALHSSQDVEADYIPYPSRRHIQASSIPMDQIAYIAEGAMERGGFTGRQWAVTPHRYRDESGRRIFDPAEQEMTALAHEVLGDDHIVVIATNWFDGSDTVHGQTDFLNYINVEYQTNELTVLHECAHIKRGQPGHDAEWMQIAFDLYSRYLGPEAGQAFWTLVEPYVTGEPRQSTAASQPQVMYHVAPADRDIETQGLQMGPSPWEEPQHNPGIFLYDDWQSAQDYAECRRADGRIPNPVIYRVDVSGLQLERDPEAEPDNEYDYRYVSREPIPSERIRRIAKTAAGYWDEFWQGGPTVDVERHRRFLNEDPRGEPPPPPLTQAERAGLHWLGVRPDLRFGDLKRGDQFAVGGGDGPIWICEGVGTEVGRAKTTQGDSQRFGVTYPINWHLPVGAKPAPPREVPPTRPVDKREPWQQTLQEFAADPRTMWHGTKHGTLGEGDLPLVHLGDWYTSHQALAANIAGMHAPGAIQPHPTAAMHPLRIVGPMASGMRHDWMGDPKPGLGPSPERMLKAQFTRGQRPRTGYYYKNEGEGVRAYPDLPGYPLTYATSAVVPHPSWLKSHEDFVREALAEGKPVAPEVLADYPHLQTARTSAVEDGWEFFTFPTGKRMEVNWEQSLIRDPEDPEGVESFDDFISNMGWHHNPSDFVEAPDPHEQFWADPQVVYHGTDEENIPAIMREGLQPRDKTRGIQNRYLGPAIFTTPSQGAAEYHYGPTLAIDAPRMKSDGYMPQVGTDAFDDEFHKEAIARHLGMDDYYVETGIGGEDPDTVVFQEPIPPQYITRVDTPHHTAVCIPNHRWDGKWFQAVENEP